MTVPVCWACWQVTKQEAEAPFQLAVMVTAASPFPAYRLVTMPVEETDQASVMAWGCDPEAMSADPSHQHTLDGPNGVAIYAFDPLAFFRYKVPFRLLRL